MVRMTSPTRASVPVPHAPSNRHAIDGHLLPDHHAPARATTRWGAIDLNLLFVFDALNEERNLTRAGRRLGLSQPATSHALGRLRGMLRDELFIRTPEGMMPTPRAEQMAEPIRDALRVLNVALEPDAFDPVATTRVFTLRVNNYAARALVPSLARHVALEAPGACLDVEPIGKLDVLDQLDAGADVALSALVDGGERFKCVRVMEDDFVVLLDREHPAARLPAFTANHLAEIPHVVVSSSGEDMRYLDEALERQGLRRSIAVRVPLLSIVLMLVGCDRLAVVPRRVATDLTQICPLTVQDLPFASPRISLAMIWHRRLDNHPAHRWLRDAIRRSAAA